MTYEELFDAYRQVVSQRDQLAAAGDHLWAVLMRERTWGPSALTSFVAAREHMLNWEALRGIGTEPPVEDWSEC